MLNRTINTILIASLAFAASGVHAADSEAVSGLTTVTTLEQSGYALMPL